MSNMAATRDEMAFLTTLLILFLLHSLEGSTCGSVFSKSSSDWLRSKSHGGRRQAWLKGLGLWGVLLQFGLLVTAPGQKVLLSSWESQLMLLKSVGKVLLYWSADSSAETQETSVNVELQGSGTRLFDDVLLAGNTFWNKQVKTEINTCANHPIQYNLLNMLFQTSNCYAEIN